MMPAEGSFGLLGRPNSGLGFGLAFDGAATLYLSVGARLVTLDPLGGVMSEVSSFRDSQGTPVNALQIAFNPADGMLYGIEEAPAPDFLPTGQLLRICPTT